MAFPTGKNGQPSNNPSGDWFQSTFPTMDTVEPISPIVENHKSINIPVTSPTANVYNNPNANPGMMNNNPAWPNNPISNFFPDAFSANPFNGQNLNSQFMINNLAADFVLNAGMNGIYGRSRHFLSGGATIIQYLRTYFDVDNKYVLKKMFLLLFPFINSNWERKGIDDVPPSMSSPTAMMPPTGPMGSPSGRDNFNERDINQPDLYIPVMAFLTYTLIVAFVMGMRGAFSPAVLYTIVKSGLIFMGLEVLLIKSGFYLLSMPTSVSFLDVIACISYKYVGICLSVVSALFFGTTFGYWPVVGWTSLAMGVFLLKTMRRASLIPSDSGLRVKLDENTTKRNYFLFFLAVLQPLICILLTYSKLPSPIQTKISKFINSSPKGN